MQLMMIRHAIAEDRSEFSLSGQLDELRPLTAQGQKRMRRGVRGLRQVLTDLDYLVSSPLMRAVQTADIVHTAYAEAQRQQWEELAPGVQPKQLAERLAPLPADARVALVGHEPDLSGLIAWLISGRVKPFMSLKKGSACLLELPGSAQPGRATLVWALTPRLLRTLGDH